MYDPTIHTKTLSRHLQAQDFASDPALLTPAGKLALLQRAADYGCNGFPPTSLKQTRLRGKAVYGLTDVAEVVVLRHITSNIRRVTSVKQDDRSFIINCIRTLMSEGIAFRVYKLDIASFYESVDVEAILQRLSEDIAFSGQSVRALSSFFGRLKAAGVVGLPRGISLSATLAEYLMRDFDQRVQRAKHVRYFARFVDDIFIMTDGIEDEPAFRSHISSFLPDGLSFNAKSSAHPFTPFTKGSPPQPEGEFDFLGYRFRVGYAARNGEKKIARQVLMDIAPAKVRRLKTRVARSLRQYNADGDRLALRDRIRLLTSNFIYIDSKTGARRPSGLHFNYPLVDANRSSALAELDKFLRTVVMAAHPRNRLYPAALTKVQRRELVGLTFRDGFVQRRFFHLPTARLISLSTVWSYV